MDAHVSSISVSELRAQLGLAGAPILLNVRREPAYDASKILIAGARRVAPEAIGDWAAQQPRGSATIVYCAHGEEVSQGAAMTLTRERPKIDRIACPWLIRRFIDPAAKFLYAPPDQVRDVAARENAIPYDVPGVRFSHDGELCSSDTLMREFALEAPGLSALAHIGLVAYPLLQPAWVMVK